MTQYQVGAQVVMTDWVPRTTGRVLQVATWRQVLGSDNDAPCYLVQADDIQALRSWLGAGQLREADKVEG